jgi:PadR family transcriptional regulator PadR
LNAQWKKGVLELCVLSQLREKDQYGYELTERISGKLDVSAGTLYLVLKRLRDSGYLETYLVESSSGPARKYYHLTETGRRNAEADRADWLEFASKVEELL